MQSLKELLQKNNIIVTPLHTDAEGVTYELERELRKDVIARDYIKCKNIDDLNDHDIELLLKRFKITLRINILDEKEN